MEKYKSMILEEHEWDNIFIQNTQDTKTKRVLYIGDSISLGTRIQLKPLCNGKLVIDGIATSKALDHPDYIPMLQAVSAQEPRRDVVLFNNGLHGYHLDEDTYEAQYSVFVDKLLTLYPEAKLYLLLSTYTIDPEMHNDRIVERNCRITKIAEKKGLEIIDQYSVSLENASLLSSDDVHFTTEGYNVLAQSILNFLKDRM